MAEGGQEAKARRAYLEHLRAVLDRSTRTGADARALEEAAGLLEQVVAVLGPAPVVDGDDVVAGKAKVLSPLLPPTNLRVDDGVLTGTVVFPRAFEGIGAVHGGHVAATFDTILGMLGARITRCRTVSLTVDYRNLTPLAVPLDVRAEVAEVIGRKMWLHGAIRDGSTVCAEARGLFLTVPGW